MHDQIWDINPGTEDVHINEEDYQDEIEAEDGHDYLESVEGMSCEEERPGVSDASWCWSLECLVEMSPGPI